MPYTPDDLSAALSAAYSPAKTNLGTVTTDMMQDEAQPEQQPQQDFGFLDYSWDVLKAVPKGIVGAARDVVELGNLPLQAAGVTDEVPEYFGLFDPPETAAGAVVDTLAGFLTGYGAVAKGLGFAGKVGGIGMRAAKAARAAEVAALQQYGKTASKAVKLGTEFARTSTISGVASGLVFDGHEERLSNILREQAGFTDPVTEYLAADEDDTELEGRLKNMLEDFLLGGVAELGIQSVKATTRGMVNSMRIHRAGVKARLAGEDPDAAIAAAKFRLSEEQAENLALSMNTTLDEAKGILRMIDATGAARENFEFMTRTEVQEWATKRGMDFEQLDEAARGFTTLNEAGKVIIGGLKGADLDTAIHEVSHGIRLMVVDPAVANKVLRKQDIDFIGEFVGATKNEDGSWTWTTQAEENFVTAFQRYLYEGAAPSRRMAGVFNQMTNWLRNIYRDLDNVEIDAMLSPEVRQAFDNLVNNGVDGVVGQGRGIAGDLLMQGRRKFDALASLPEDAKDMKDLLDAEEWASIKSQKALDSTIALYRRFDKELLPLFRAASEAGAAVQGGYEEGAVLMEELVGRPAKELFAMFSAATSPQNKVPSHTKLGVGITAEIVARLKRNRLRDFTQEEMEAIVKVAGSKLKAKGMVKDYAKRSAGVANDLMGRIRQAREANPDTPAIELLGRIDMSGLYKNMSGAGLAKGAGKVPGFAEGSAGRLFKVVLDTYMARLVPDDLFPGVAPEKLLNAKKTWISKAPNYLSMAAMVRKLSGEMGILPGQSQERIWGSIYVIAALKRAGIPEDKILKNLSNEDMLASWNLISVLKTPEVTNELRRLGASKAALEDIDITAAAIRKRVRPNLDRAIEFSDAEAAQELARRVPRAGASTGTEVIAARKARDAQILLQSRITDRGREVASDPKFKRWFGNSKVVDDKGVPIVVYHGTSKDVDFNKFRVGQRGAWFTGHPSVAGEYAAQNDSRGFKVEWDEKTGRPVSRETNTKSRVFPVFLSIQNPAKLTAEESEQLMMSTNYAKTQREIFEKYRRLGHDGIQFTDSTWVAFDPTQIKSVFNKGEWSLEDARILYQPRSPIEGATPGLGKPPETAINWERFSTVGSASEYAKELVEDTVRAMAGDEAVPLEDAIARADPALKEVTRAIGIADVGSLAGFMDAVPGRAADIRTAGDRIMASRKVLANVSDRLATLAKAKNPSREQMYEFIRGKQILTFMTYKVKEEVREVARILNAQRVIFEPDPNFRLLPDLNAKPADVTPPVKPTDAATPAAVPTPATVPTPTPVLDAGSKAATMDSVITDAGGEAAVRAEMDKYATAAASGNPMALVRLSRTQRVGNVLVEYFMNSILSNPVTQVVNVLGTGTTAFYLPVEKMLGASLRGDFRTVGSQIRHLNHLMHVGTDAFSFAAAALKSGQNVLEEVGTSEVKTNAISAAGFGMADDSLAGQAVTWLGRVLNVPSRFLTTTDEFFKQLNYRAALMTELEMEGLTKFKGDRAAAEEWARESYDKMITNGQQYAEKVIMQKAMAEADKAVADGTITAEERTTFIARFMSDQNNWDPKLGALSQTALDYARYSTFTTPLVPGEGGAISRISARVQQAVDEHPLARFVIPFIRTPTRILEFTLDRSLPGQAWNLNNAFGKLKQDLTHAEASVRSEAMGRVAFSTLTVFTVGGMFYAGRITGAGPENQAERDAWLQAGNQPYSIKMGDGWVSYRRMDPFASMIGIIVDTMHSYAYANERQRPQLESVLHATIVGLANNITNKSYLTGLTNVVNAIKEPGRFGNNLVNQYVSAAVPFSSGLRQAKGTFDDDLVVRDVRNMSDAILNTVPGWAKDVAPRRNMFGEAITRPQGLFADMVSPFSYTAVKDDVILRELDQIGHSFAAPREVRSGMDLTKMVGKNGQTAYDRWMELHGQVKIGNRTLRESMLRLIRSKEYQRLSPDTTDMYDSPRVRVMRSVVEKYRRAAFKQVMNEFPEVAGGVQRDFAIKRAMKNGRPVQELMDLVNR